MRPEKEAARTKTIDEPSGEEPERQRHEDLAVGVSRRDLLTAPAELLHEVRVEARQTVQREADDGEEGKECRQDRDDLAGTFVRLPVHVRAGAFASLMGGAFAPLRIGA